MKLCYSPTSPYVRKVVILAQEAGLDDRLERIESNAWSEADPLPNTNPLGKVPALVTDEGEALYDSVVICEYLDSLHDGAKFFPANGDARWRALRQHALANGILDAAILAMLENKRRPEALRWEAWSTRQTDKVTRALDKLESEASSLGDAPNIATVTVGCALGYLDFRFPDLDWRGSRPALADWYASFSQRRSFQATVPKDP